MSSETLLSDRSGQDHLAARLGLPALTHPLELHDVAGDRPFHEIAARPVRLDRGVRRVDVMDVEADAVALQYAVLDEEHSVWIVAGTANDARDLVIANLQCHVLLRNPAYSNPSSTDV